MRKASRLFIVLLTLLVSIALTPAMAQEEWPVKSKSATDAYDFPVKPGMPEWSAFTSHDEMLAACQVPEAILQTMSTEGLVATVLSYPLFGDMLAYNSLQHGFDTVAATFNGLSALLARLDAGTRLLAVYRQMDPLALDKGWTLEQQGQYDASFTYIEMLLAQDAILANMTAAERLDLLAEALAKAKAKQQVANVYGHRGQERTALVLARILKYADPDAFSQLADVQADLGAFLADGTFASPQALGLIYARAEQLLGGSTATSGSVPDGVKPEGITPLDYNSYVYTPKGTAVPVIVKTYELTPAQIAQMNQWVAQTYPCATRETNASRKYNCHSYAWHSQSTSNDKWMNTPGDDTYWNDRSYFFIRSGSYDSIPSSIYNGAKVAYPSSSDHSAIKASSTQLRSKWGEYPQMLHKPTCSPYGASTLNYYQPNLILKVPAYATSNQSSSYPPSKGNDGETGTRWSSQISSSLGPQWWWANMGSTKTVNNVQVMWETAYAKRHFVGTSTDCVNFTGYWYTISQAGYYRYVLGNRSAKCVGIYMTERAPCCNNYSIWEVEAFQINPSATSSTTSKTESIPEFGGEMMAVPLGEPVTLQLPQQ